MRLIVFEGGQVGFDWKADPAERRRRVGIPASLAGMLVTSLSTSKTLLMENMTMFLNM